MSQKKYILPGFTASISIGQKEYYQAIYNDRYIGDIEPALIGRNAGDVGGVGYHKVCSKCKTCTPKCKDCVKIPCPKRIPRP